jgi:hypothetical protein
MVQPAIEVGRKIYKSAHKLIASAKIPRKRKRLSSVVTLRPTPTPFLNDSVVLPTMKINQIYFHSSNPDIV